MAEKSNSYKQLRKLYENQISITDDYRRQLKEKDIEVDQLRLRADDIDKKNWKLLDILSVIEEAVLTGIDFANQKEEESKPEEDKKYWTGKITAFLKIKGILNTLDESLENKTENDNKK